MVDQRYRAPRVGKEAALVLPPRSELKDNGRASVPTARTKPGQRARPHLSFGQSQSDAGCPRRRRRQFNLIPAPRRRPSISGNLSRTVGTTGCPSAFSSESREVLAVVRLLRQLTSISGGRREHRRYLAKSEWYWPVNCNCRPDLPAEFSGTCARTTAVGVTLLFHKPVIRQRVAA